VRLEPVLGLARGREQALARGREQALAQVQAQVLALVLEPHNRQR